MDEVRQFVIYFSVTNSDDIIDKATARLDHFWFGHDIRA